MKQKKIITHDNSSRTFKNINSILKAAMSNKFVRIRLSNQIMKALMMYEPTDILSVLNKTVEQCNFELTQLGPELWANLPAHNATARLNNLCKEAKEWNEEVKSKHLEHQKDQNSSTKQKI